MPKNSLKGKSRCTICGALGSFLTPQGLMCHQDALSAAIDQEASDGEKWMPVKVKQPDTTPEDSTSDEQQEESPQ